MISARSLVLSSLVALGSLVAAGSAAAHPIVTFPNGQEAFAPGVQIQVSWFYLIDHGAGTINIWLSTDGGVNWGGNPVATTQWPATTVPVTIPQTPGELNLIMVEYIPNSGGDWPDTSDDFFCINDPAVSAMNFFVGSNMYFQVQAPSMPNGVGVVFANMTGATGVPLNLPGGVSLDLAPDIWTMVLLSLPPLSVVPLDGSGIGSSAQAGIPNNPLLSGWTWAIATAILPPGVPFGWPFQSGSCTVTPSVL